jgi:hypothetical protein
LEKAFAKVKESFPDGEMNERREWSWPEEYGLQRWLAIEEHEVE